MVDLFIARTDHQKTGSGQNVWRYSESVFLRLQQPANHCKKMDGRSVHKTDVLKKERCRKRLFEFPSESKPVMVKN